jgi:peptide/bleomycin uptake transporter
VLQQITRAFDRVEAAFQYLVLSWGTIVELISVYKRLRAFERQIAEHAKTALPPAEPA